MSWVEPIGYVRLLKGVALEPGYENTIYFESKQEQYNYFFHHDGISFNEQTYTRYNRGIIRVARNIRDCYQVNYLMYCNDVPSGYSSSQKWFYCFVSEVNYIAENVTEIVFEPDLLQTWMFDYDLGSCYVERQHTTTDEPGDWLEEEGLEIGPYEYQEFQGLSEFNEWSVVVGANFNATWDVYNDWTFTKNDGGEMYAGVYNAIKYYMFDVFTVDGGGNFIYNQSELSRLRNFFKGISGWVLDWSPEIVSVFMIPTAFGIYSGTGHATLIEPYEANHYVEKKIPISANNYANKWVFHADDEGYSSNTNPKNGKLYTYPYTGLAVTNETNAVSVFPYEYFKSPLHPERAEFNLKATLSVTTESWLVPLNYKGLGQNYLEKMELGNFPMCSYTTDNYLLMVANSMVGFGEMILNDYAAFQRHELADISSLRIWNRQRVGSKNETPYQATQRETENKLLRRESKAVEKLGNVNLALEVGQNLGNYVRSIDMHFPFSATQTNVLAAATRRLGFHFYNFKITEKYAKKIDEYFTRYGYAIKRMMIPNRYARTKWTYVKTIGLNFTRCDMPGDIAEEIRRIYEQGVTWWKATFYIDQTTGRVVDGNPPGNYSGSNNLLS